MPDETMEIAIQEFCAKFAESYGIAQETMHLSQQAEIEALLKKAARLYVAYNGAK